MIHCCPQPARHARRQRHAGSGFTLLELILAAAMLAIIATALFSALSVAFRARTQAAAQVDAMREASIVTDIIRQDFESILPPGGTLGGTFTGATGGTTGAAADWVEFYALGRDSLAADDDPLAEGARRITLQLRTDIQPHALVRQVESNLLAPIEREPAEEVLSHAVRELTLRYHDGDGWVTQWDSEVDGQVLPRAVELTITFNAPSPVDPARPYRITQVIPLSPAADPQEQEESGA